MVLYCHCIDHTVEGAVTVTAFFTPWVFASRSVDGLYMVPSHYVCWWRPPGTRHRCRRRFNCALLYGPLCDCPQAYKNFSKRVREVKRKLEELAPELPDVSPVPSPDVNAPSPTNSDDGLQLPDDGTADGGAAAAHTEGLPQLTRLERGCRSSHGWGGAVAAYMVGDGLSQLTWLGRGVTAHMVGDGMLT